MTLAMIGYVTWKDYDITEREITVFTARAADAMKDGHFDRAMRYALMAYRRFQPRRQREMAESGAHALIWDTVSGREIAQLKGHTGPVLSANFSPDGRRAVTASLDGTARIWDADSGGEIVLLNGHTGRVSSAAFSPDGARVATASGDGTARICDVTWATLVSGNDLREGVCAEKLIGPAQNFTDAELEDLILRGMDKNDRIARNPCLRRGPLSLDYWARLPGQLWRSFRVNVFAN
jgi:dipeptidyl aminopeptidase/acylaminoacyl peptidase